ncbi:hypothetical protein IFM12276_31190 [Nocardia sputorum]|uniref:Uncharacterized protein n=1 Tax=Nocardia sputorum TaxID=2984338 RepID=A0ABM8CYI1_9NOCA|nr:hypothetical protein IFM12276_31190 [Nocardia sputorum]
MMAKWSAEDGVYFLDSRLLSGCVEVAHMVRSASHRTSSRAPPLISSAPPIAVDGDNRYNGMSLVDGHTRLHTGRVYARAACVADMRVRRPDHAAFRSALF